jgi:hypothetical protein
LLFKQLFDFDDAKRIITFSVKNFKVRFNEVSTFLDFVTIHIYLSLALQPIRLLELNILSIATSEDEKLADGFDVLSDFVLNIEGLNDVHQASSWRHLRSGVVLEF